MSMMTGGKAAQRRAAEEESKALVWWEVGAEGGRLNVADGEVGAQRPQKPSAAAKGDRSTQQALPRVVAAVGPLDAIFLFVY